MPQDLTLTVDGMTCGGCENAVRRALGALPGIQSVQASHVEHRVTVSYEPTLVTPDAVTTRIEKLGYRVVA